MDEVRRQARSLPKPLRPDPLAEAPPGWVYNPSSWAQRVPIAILAFVGFAIATWLTLFQLGVLPTIWEPFFGDGSRVILTSRVSHLLPVPDAALGAAGYLADAVFGLVGGPARWRRLPWVVIAFAIAVIPFGLVSLTLFILQPTLFDAWCRGAATIRAKRFVQKQRCPSDIHTDENRGMVQIRRLMC